MGPLDFDADVLCLADHRMGGTKAERLAIMEPTTADVPAVSTAAAKFAAVTAPTVRSPTVTMVRVAMPTAADWHRQRTP